MIRFALLARGRTGVPHAHDPAKASGARFSTIYDPVVAVTAPLHGARVLAEATLASVRSGWTIKVEAIG